MPNGPMRRRRSAHDMPVMGHSLRTDCDAGSNSDVRGSLIGKATRRRDSSRTRGFWQCSHGLEGGAGVECEIVRVVLTPAWLTARPAPETTWGSFRESGAARCREFEPQCCPACREGRYLYLLIRQRERGSTACRSPPCTALSIQSRNPACLPASRPVQASALACMRAELRSWVAKCNHGRGLPVGVLPRSSREEV